MSSADETGSRAHTQAVVSITFLALAWPTVALRLWVRGYMTKVLGWDDAMMVVSAMMFTVYCASLLVITAHGGGTQSPDVDDVQTAVNWVIVSIASYLQTTMFLKLSLGLFFLRITVRTWHRYVIFAVMTISTLIHICNTFITIFQCGNPRGYLLRTLENKCIPRSVQLGLAYEQCAVATITDWVFAILPFFILWDSKLDSRSKISVGFILILGTVSSICSMVRFKYVDGLSHMNNFFWSAANSAIWCVLEAGIGIIAGSLAAMRPLFKRIAYHTTTRFHRSFKSLSKGSGTHSGNASLDFVQGHPLGKRNRWVSPSPEKQVAGPCHAEYLNVGQIQGIDVVDAYSSVEEDVDQPSTDIKPEDIGRAV